MILLIKIIILVNLKKSGFSKETIHHLMSQQTLVKKPIPFRPVTYDHVSRLIDKYQKAERDLLYYMMQDKSMRWNMKQKQAICMIKLIA